MSEHPYQTPPPGSQQTVVVQGEQQNGLALAGLIFSAIGWLTCGLLCIPGALLSFIGLFGRGSKGVAIAGLIVGFPGVAFFAFVGVGLIMSFLGLGAVVVSAPAAMESARIEAEKTREFQEQVMQGHQLEANVNKPSALLGIGSTFESSGFSLTMESASITTPEVLDEIGEPLDLDSKDLVMRFQVANTDTRKTLRYKKTNAFEPSDFVLYDDAGNRIHQVSYGPMSRLKNELTEQDVIDPGENATHVLVFSSPSSSTQYLELDFNTRCLGGRKIVTFRMTMDQILRGDEDESTSAISSPPEPLVGSNESTLDLIMNAGKSSSGSHPEDFIGNSQNGSNKQEEEGNTRGAAALEMQPGPPAEREPELEPFYRTFSDASGQFSVEAEVVTATADSVKLRRKDNGKEITLRIGQLSEADQEWLRENYP